MNERIEKLYKQATKQDYFPQEGEEVYMSGKDLAKFAELIVLECAMLVEKLSPGYTDYRNQIEDAFRRDCVEEIKQHFGVEE